MNCQQLAELLPGYLDKELDLVRSLEFEHHLKGCSACAQRYEEALALHKALANEALYFTAPKKLSRELRKAVQQAAGAEAPRARHNWDLSGWWLKILAPVAVAGLVLLAVLPWLGQPSAETLLAQQIVSAHVRSLIPNHLTDVASTDQHTVKPWFNGKVTFSPPVVDPAAQGFPLVGGRLDVIAEHPVAALIYQRRKHYINLFIWPSAGGSMTEKSLSQRGYNVVHWSEDGMNYWAVSDISQDELQDFARLVGAPQQK